MSVFLPQSLLPLPLLLLLALLALLPQSTTAQTDPPTVHNPSSSINANAISSTFVIDFTIPEQALANSLIFEMNPFPDDGKGIRYITFGSAALSAGRRQITITPFSSPQPDATLVSSVTCDVADCSPGDGAAYLFLLRYTGVEGGDAEATSQTDVLYIDLQTDPISMITPSSDAIAANGFHVQFSKPEEALSGSLTLTLTRTGGVADAAANRVVVLSSNMESQTGNSALLSMTRLSFLLSSSPSLVVSVTPSIDLVTGTIYTLTASYQDKAGNDASTASRTGITFDGATEDAIVYSPTSSIPTFAEDFLFHFELPEEAEPGSFKLKITATDADSGGLMRTISFVTSFNQAGSHTVTFGPLSTLQTDNADVVSITNPIDLVNNQEYVMGVVYQDLQGNQEVEVLIAPIRFDNATLPISASAPVTGGRLILSAAVTFQLPERAKPGSVQMIFTPATDIYGGAVDSNGPRTIVLSSSVEAPGTHTFVLGQLATAAADTSEVTSVTPAISLVHAAKYILEFKYQDQASNSFSSFLVNDLECDVATDPIVSTSPNQALAVTFVGYVFTVSFTLPEAAEDGSLTLTIEPTGSDRAGTIDYQLPRVVTLANSVGLTSGTKTVEIGRMTSFNTNNVISVTPAENLLDGVVYQFTYSYKDQFGNAATETQFNGVRYAGWLSQRPTLTSPSDGSVLPSPFNLVFQLPERPLESSNTVKLTITPTGGTYIDAFAPRVLVFDRSSVVSSGDYTLSISPLSTLAATAAFVDSVTPSNDLVDGALYTMTLEYQDGVGNPANTTSSESVAFAGFETLPMYVHDPRVNVTMANAFLVNYTLSETALRGSMKLLLTYVFGNDPVHTTRSIVFGQSMETPGNHYVQMQELSTAGGLTAIDTVTPSNDLIDGTAYDLILQYQDGAANEAYQVSQPGMYFAGIATMAPTWYSPEGTSSLPAAFVVSYTLPEMPTPGSVKLVISRTDGLPDPAGIRIITFATSVELQNVRHNITMNALALINTTVPEVLNIEQEFLIHPGGTADLIDGTQYRFTFQYQDFGKNPVFSEVRNLIYYSGAGTLLPTFILPADDTYVGTYFGIDFTLPEPALPHTAFLKFQRTGGLPDPGSPHQVIFNEDLERPTQHQVNLQEFNNVTGLSFVRSATSAGSTPQDLIDGSIYTVILSYQDGGGNPPATQIHTNVIFAGSVTKPAIVTLPQENITVKTNFDVRFELPEGKLKLFLKLFFVFYDVWWHRKKKT